MKNVCVLTLAMLGVADAVSAQESDQYLGPVSRLAAGIEGAVVADVNRNGLVDVIGAGTNDDGVPILQVAVGDGDRGFTQRPTQAIGLTGVVNDVASGDVDGDGFPDLVAIIKRDAFSPPDLHVSRNLGTLLAKFNVLLNLPFASATANAWDVELVDIDADGVLDVVVAVDDSLLRLLGRGDGTFEPAEVALVATDLTAFALGELDGDGIPDLVAVEESLNSLTVLQGDGGGAFTEVGSYSVTSPAGVVIADLDADGDRDLATSSSIVGGGIAVLRGTGAATFDAPQVVDVLQPTGLITAGDYNSDGIVDLVAARGASSGLSIVRGLGAGDFVFARLEGTLLPVTRIESTNVNGDLATDWVISTTITSSQGGLARLTIALGRPNQLNLLPPVGPGVGQTNGVLDIVVADLNGDGLDDKISRKTEHLSVSLWTGGDYTPNVSLGSLVPFGPLVDVEVGDFDGDGFIDAAAASKSTNLVFTYRGRGDGTFDPVEATAIGVEGLSRALAAADLDGDGDDELVVAIEGLATDDGLFILDGSPGGGLAVVQELANVNSAGEIVQAELHDLDRDGVLDLLLLASDYTIRYRRGVAGTYDFTPTAEAPVPPEAGAEAFPPRYFVAGQFDPDSEFGSDIDDVAVMTTNGISVLNGFVDFVSGDISFDASLKVPFPAGSFIAAPAGEDGALGLIVPTITDVRVLRQDEFGFYETIDRFSGGVGLLARARLNNDDRLDFVGVGAQGLRSYIGQPPLPWTVLRGATAPFTESVPSLRADGDPSPGSEVRLEYSGGLPTAQSILVVGLDAEPPAIPLQGGFVVPSPDILIPLPLTDGLGDLGLDVTWTDFPPGIRLWTQVWQVAGPDTHASNTLTVESR